MLAFTRWGFDPPRESLRLVTLGMDALKRLGEDQPARHFMAIREDSARLHGYGALDTVLISRKPFSEAGRRPCAGLCEAGRNGGAVPSGRSAGKRVSETDRESRPRGISSRLHLRRFRGERRPAILFLHGAAPGFLDAF